LIKNQETIFSCKKIIFREGATSLLAGFDAVLLPYSNWNLEILAFTGGRKTEEPGEKPWQQGENQQQTQPTYDTRPESTPGYTVPTLLIKGIFMR